MKSVRRPNQGLAAELQERLDEDSAVRTAFEALTPGRRREYNLYISGAKQAKTRHARAICALGDLHGRSDFSF